MGTDIIKFRPLWSIFVIATEKWLCSMSAGGLHVKDVRFSRGVFLFTRGEPQKLRYCLSFHKFSCEGNSDESRMLEKNGWQVVTSYDKWSLCKTENLDELGVMPNRRGLYLRNNSLLCGYSIVSFLILLIALAALMGNLFFSGGAYGTGSYALSEIFVFGAVFLLLIIANFMLFLWLSLTNNKILGQLGASLDPAYAIYSHYIRNKTFEKWLEKRIIKSGDILRRFWPLWFFAPDRLEKRLAEMERNGLNFYKVSRTGLFFYFIKGSSRKVEYCVLCRNAGDLEDTIDYLKRGWNVDYTTAGQSVKILLLSKSYEQEKPVFFTSKRECVRNAGRILQRRSIRLIFVILFSVILLIPFLIFRIQFYIPQAVVIIGCILLFLRTVCYYRRVKKSESAAYRRKRDENITIL